MQEWHNRIGDMLAYVSDILTLHGFDEIVKDDFAALRQMSRKIIPKNHRQEPAVTHTTNH
jgi:hypothetical protein